MQLYLQVIITGLLMGGVYALITVGLTMIHGVMKIVNFAQGDFLAIGMYLTFVMYRFMPENSIPYWLIIPVGAAMYLLGCIIFQTTIKRVIGKGDSNYILLTIGLSIMIQNILLLIFNADFRTLPVSDALRVGTFNLGNVRILYPWVIAFAAATIFVIFVNWFLGKTDIGRAMRATSENIVVAESLGIRTGRIFITAFAMGTMFAGISGLLITPVHTFSPVHGDLFAILAMSAMVLGGLGNIKGALVGGLIIGLVQSFTGTFLDTRLELVAVNLVLLLVLIFRPVGLFGKQRRAA